MPKKPFQSAFFSLVFERENFKENFNERNVVSSSLHFSTCFWEIYAIYLIYSIRLSFCVIWGSYNFYLSSLGCSDGDDDDASVN